MNSLLQGTAAWSSFTVEPGLSLQVWTCHGAEPGPAALLTAGVHGDEYEGPAAVLEFTRSIDPAHVRGTITAIPVVNPMAFAAGTRTSPEDGANLARVFPGNASGTVTERLAAAVWDRFVSHTQYLIDLHSGGVEYVFLPVAGFYGEPGADNASYQAAARFGLPALWQLPPIQGVMSNEASNRDIVAIGHEYLGAGQLSPQGMRSYVEGIRSCLGFWNILLGTPPFEPTMNMYKGDWQLAPCEGLFLAHRSIGSPVVQGDLVAEIRRLDASAPGETTQIHAERDGTLLGLRSKAFIREGNWAILIGKAGVPA